MGKQFLHNLTDQSVRNTITGILDSYHNYWDLLAELTQNSRDAILRRSEKETKFQGEIKLHIDYSDRSVHILDNGIGLSEEKVEEYAAPNSGDKIARGKEIGQKGVGLTYCIFKGDAFQIKSRTLDGEEYAGEILNGNKWLKGGKKQNIKFPEIEDLHFNAMKSCFGDISSKSFTYICVKNISSDSGNAPDIFDMTPEQLQFLLTTRTIVGNVNAIFNEDFEPEFEFELSFNLKGALGSVSDSISVYAGHPKFHSTQKKNSTLSEAKDKKSYTNNITSLRSHFKNRTVYHVCEESSDGRKLQIYAVLFPSVATFPSLRKETYKLDFDKDEFNEDYPLLRSGIFVATQGMPTAINIEHPSGGSHETNYKRMFFLVQDDQLSFDMGRKTLHHTHVKRIQKVVKRIFLELEHYVPLQGNKVGKQEGIEWTEAQRQRQKIEEWGKINNVNDLNFPKIAYSKIPENQEAGVVAIFHELLGAGLMGDGHYSPLKSGYGTQYDLYASYTEENGEPLNIVIEFKTKLESIIMDLDSQAKTLRDMNLLIAWDANFVKFDEACMSLDEVDEEDNTHYFGVNYALSTNRYDPPMPVILLKKYIENLSK